MARPNFLLPLDLKSLRARRCAFTLTELLVVMGVIGTLAVLTLIGVRKVSKDARLALGTNTVIAALSEARSLAIRKHKYVLVAFLPRRDGSRSQVVDVIVAESTGESCVNFNSPHADGDGIERFVPVAGMPVRAMPEGISVASPFYHSLDTSFDETWEPLTYLPWVGSGQGEMIGQPPGVMFAADGTRVLRSTNYDRSRAWLDINNDGWVRLDQVDYAPADVPLNWDREFAQIYEDDEAFISLAPFLAVYDFDDAVERKSSDWSDLNDPQHELVGRYGYITQLGNRIHFNRYSGVIMR